VKPPPGWYKSSFCGNGACVEVARVGDEFLVRDSKGGEGGNFLTFDRNEWAEFVNGVRAGEFDPA
jgi:hypothetical protein